MDLFQSRQRRKRFFAPRVARNQYDATRARRSRLNEAGGVAGDGAVHRHRAGMKQVQRPDIQRPSGEIDSRRRFGLDSHLVLHLDLPVHRGACPSGRRVHGEPVVSSLTDLARPHELEMGGAMERPMGLEPTPGPWQGPVLPLYYGRPEPQL